MCTLRSNEIVTLDMYCFHIGHGVDATNMCHNKRCNPHLGIVVMISIIGSTNRSAHVQFHLVQNSRLSLDSLC